MTTANKVLDLAAAEIDYTEKPVNLTKYGAHYGANGAQWCGYFAKWVLERAGIRIGGGGYTPAMAASFESLHQYHTKGDPMPGDLVFMDFPHDGIDRISHVGICVRVCKDGRVMCIEGNTSGNDSGDQRNGGMVSVKRRNRNVIVGWGRPRYVLAPVPLSRVIDETTTSEYSEAKPQPIKKAVKKAAKNG